MHAGWWHCVVHVSLGLVVSLHRLQLLLIHVLKRLHSAFVEVRHLVWPKVVYQSFVHVVRILIVVKVYVERRVKHHV